MRRLVQVRQRVLEQVLHNMATVPRSGIGMMPRLRTVVLSWPSDWQAQAFTTLKMAAPVATAGATSQLKLCWRHEIVVYLPAGVAQQAQATPAPSPESAQTTVLEDPSELVQAAAHLPAQVQVLQCTAAVNVGVYNMAKTC